MIMRIDVHRKLKAVQERVDDGVVGDKSAAGSDALGLNQNQGPRNKSFRRGGLVF